ncbi:YhbY family RNA-binding protein [Nitrosovibrio tenuis]|uniref:RNA-binding protein n=1 Tax=Nitrosovibrio tenuis TaxID=1233 RepID=A0A1H7GA72_9PROT|nr:YhbY family RNA-binding protein [Nitrosovibrio tenuis]SEK33400.1 RNA-binding protein [Nitrosovibrio tenuis]
MLALTSIVRRNLRVLAHSIRPVVWIGTAGLSESVMNELDQALKSHELIKIRVADCNWEARDAMLAEICQKLGASPVRHIGRILVVYRPKEDEISGETTDKAKKDKAKRTR